jgi:periplasmic protein TonB
MTQSVTMRTTSLLASAALMSALVIAAFTMTVVFAPQVSWPDGPTFEVATLPPPAPPVPAPQQPTPPMERPIESLYASEDPIQAIEEQISDSGATVLGPVQLEIITRPRWVRTPSELQGYYPRRALTRAMEGDVVLDCLVSTAGSLGCRVVSETPDTWGFGEAALRISRDYQMVPAMRAGQPVEGRYRMRVPFRVD